ncbi:hypothetical protein LCGC14_1993320 [marine sediment metagenome]|uniref:Sulfotransferase domain-containing protein n=1 Tax=marine sediment metagenome TaxID=412755 RepID=A0A0F9HIS5_9ZZZZ
MWSLFSENFNQDKIGFWAPYDWQGLLSCRNHASLDAFSGHLPYTTKQFFPDDRGVFTYTIFREPIERMYSQYLYLRKIRPDLSIKLEEFVSSQYMAVLADNVQTRMLGSMIPIDWMSQVDHRDTIDISIGRFLLESIEIEDRNGLLETAIQRLDELDCFGIKEFLAESGRRLANKTGLSVDVKERSGEHRKHAERLSKKEVNMMKALNELDIELYKEAVAKFENSDLQSV